MQLSPTEMLIAKGSSQEPGAVEYDKDIKPLPDLVLGTTP
jgi:hypothetical protein